MGDNPGDEGYASLSNIFIFINHKGRKNNDTVNKHRRKATVNSTLCTRECVYVVMVYSAL